MIWPYFISEICAYTQPTITMKINPNEDCNLDFDAEQQSVAGSLDRIGEDNFADLSLTMMYKRILGSVRYSIVIWQQHS